MKELTSVQYVILPENTSSQKSFDEAIQILWPDVEGSAFQLCVGTDLGKWDIMSASVGNRRQQLLDLSDVPASVQTICVQLITIAEDPEDGMVGETIEIKRFGASIVPTTYSLVQEKEPAMNGPAGYQS